MVKTRKSHFYRQLMNGLRYLIASLTISASAFCSALDVSAKTAIVIDASSGKVLWSKNSESSMYPASTTKIMTGLLLVEHCKPNEIITAPDDIETIREASMHLKPGEKVSAHDMLYAIMLRSANDGCYAIAKHISGSVDAFSKLMNERARQVGCTNTHFTNPNGLNDWNHTTTAHDLALMARAAMKYPEFREAVRTIKYSINRSMNTKDCVMVNHDKWLRKDPTADGIKTGFTVPAGHCFVGSAMRNGFRVITVVMKSDHWQQDHQELLDWAFDTFEKKQKIDQWSIVGQVKVPGGAKSTIPVAVAQEAYTLGPKGKTVAPMTTTVVALPALKAPVARGDKVGELVVVDADGWKQRIPVVAKQDVQASLVSRLNKGPGTSSFLFCGALFVGVVWVQGRKKRRIGSYGRSTKKYF